jgi:hypothetical protein
MGHGGMGAWGHGGMGAWGHGGRRHTHLPVAVGFPSPVASRNVAASVKAVAVPTRRTVTVRTPRCRAASTPHPAHRVMAKMARYGYSASTPSEAGGRWGRIERPQPLPLSRGGMCGALHHAVPLNPLPSPARGRAEAALPTHKPCVRSSVGVASALKSPLQGQRACMREGGAGGGGGRNTKGDGLRSHPTPRSRGQGPRAGTKAGT